MQQFGSKNDYVGHLNVSVFTLKETFTNIIKQLSSSSVLAYLASAL